MNLNQLPNDIWSILLELPSIRDELLTLLMVGNRALYGRIIRVCTSYSSPKSLETATILKMPSLLKDLTALQSFRISAAGFKGYTYPKLKVLLPVHSPNLTTIELSGLGFEWLLVATATSRFATSKSGPMYLVTSMLDIGKLFPVLQVLKVRSSLDSFTLRVSPSCFAVLPHTLHTFHWNAQVPHDSADYSHLPSGLTSLELKASITHGKPLPSQLRHLSGIMASNPKEVGKLPRTLTSGDWLHQHTEFSPRLARAMPPSLTELPSYAIFNSEFNEHLTEELWTQFLPKSLTTLNTHDNILSIENLRLLPRTLTSLQFFNLEAISVSDHIKTDRFDQPEIIFHAPWPPLLTRLVTTACGPPIDSPSPTLDSSTFEFLPRSLKTLQILGLTITGSTSQCSALPPHLTDLALDLSTADDQEPHLPFPNEITNLDVRHLVISRTSVKCLPPGLIRLALIKTDIPSMCTKRLPRSITYLTVQSIVCTKIAKLPPGLVSLSSTYIRGLLDKDMLSMLPQTLKSFFWAQCGLNTGDADTIFAIAPRLNTLHLPACTLSYEFFKILPNLKRFCGVISIMKATRSDIKILVKKLPPRFTRKLEEILLLKTLPYVVTYGP